MRDQLVVVTGSASGIGLATVRELRRDGALVIGVDRAGPPAELSDATNLEWIRGDVTAQETWDQYRRRCGGVAQMGRTV